jgi:hypothetical protein
MNTNDDRVDSLYKEKSQLEIEDTTLFGGDKSGVRIGNAEPQPASRLFLVDQFAVLLSALYTRIQVVWGRFFVMRPLNQNYRSPGFPDTLVTPVYGYTRRIYDCHCCFTGCERSFSQDR